MRLFRTLKQQQLPLRRIQKPGTLVSGLLVSVTMLIAHLSQSELHRKGSGIGACGTEKAMDLFHYHTDHPHYYRYSCCYRGCATQQHQHQEQHLVLLIIFCASVSFGHDIQLHTYYTTHSLVCLYCLRIIFLILSF